MTVIEQVSTIPWNTDDWETPDSIAQAMTQLILLSDLYILEPCAGTGQIVKHIAHPYMRNILCMDINKSRMEKGQRNAPDCTWLCTDFLRSEIELATEFDLVITNPPFSKCMEFIGQYSSVKPKKLNYVGWVEERNPTFAGLCWVSLRSTQPTIILN
ncbi:hypothetical protein [Nostoc sp. MG11]|uniref:hypothetical protein n=1 Tax=Nostoc sp. MG11 TaxID=2721166 RepID=UPI001866697B|nr:hypothetical protein [Nostoc sp. MG11]